MPDPRSHAVCCLCGDVGFPANLFRCLNSCNRFQHSYCSNYYGESAETIEVCDWCRSEERSGRPARANPPAVDHHNINITVHQRPDDGTERQRNSGGVPSPRPAPRRYKLLKDVMC